MESDKKNILDCGISLIEKLYYIFLTLIFLGAVFNIFYNLGKVPIDSWDEARHGISAYEMFKNNNYIVNTFAYKNDYWNLKPPISFWAIGLGYKLAGFNPLGLRLVSGLAALSTIAIIAFFTKYKYGRLASLISALVLTTTTQYILSHSARTGDADSLYVLFFTISMVTVALSEQNIKWLYVSGFAFSLSFLTKSWHAICVVAITGIYMLFSKTLFKMRVKGWLYFLGSSFSPIIIWAILRFQNDRFVFFKKMIEFDLLERTSRTLEGHTGGPFYYLLTFQYGYFYWLLALVAGLVLYAALYRSIDKIEKNTALLLFLWITVPLVLYTIAKTKITWYILPVFPAFAVCTGGLSSSIFKAPNRKLLVQLVIAAGIVFSAYSYERTIIKNITSVISDDVQATLQEMKYINEFKGRNIYTMCGNGEVAVNWRQSDILAAELYGDLKSLNGGYDSFIKDKTYPLIIVPRIPEYSGIINNKSFKTIVQNKTHCILSK